MGIFGVWIVPMRNWNENNGRTPRRRPCVWIVPMRNWNLHRLTSFQHASARLDRTYEELKPRWQRDHPNAAHCLDRTYEELKHAQEKGESLTIEDSLDRTYEELKLASISRRRVDMSLFGSYLWGIETMTITPRRSYTDSSLDRTYEELKLISPTAWIHRNYRFGSYLWGIETIYRKGKWHHAEKVWIVPMRNWNQPDEWDLPHDGWVWIVPMRNWNQKSMVPRIPVGFRLDRTYEELKQPFPIRNISRNIVFGSYLWGIET